MAGDEFVGWVFARVDDWQGKSQGMGDVLDAVHQPTLAGIDFQDTGSFVAGEESLDRVPLHAAMPVCLGESSLLYYIARLKKVAVHISGVSPDLNLGGDFDIRRHIKLNVDHLEIFDADKGGVVVHHLQIVLEERRASAGEIEERLVGHGWAQVLLGVVLWDVRPAKLGWADEEPPRVGG